jgi:SAM-dependent methyltransferase
METLECEAPASTWDRLYLAYKTPWRSGGLSDTTKQLLSHYSRGPRLLELGCGTGDDVAAIIEMGFDYVGLDLSETAINDAASRNRSSTGTFVCVDFFRWAADSAFDVVYDKGLFHGLAGVRRRNTFIRRAAAVLRPGGVWVSVCGSADRRRADFCHGAIYLRDLVAPTEIYFEVL